MGTYINVYIVSITFNSLGRLPIHIWAADAADEIISLRTVPNTVSRMRCDAGPQNITDVCGVTGIDIYVYTNAIAYNDNAIFNTFVSFIFVIISARGFYVVYNVDNFQFFGKTNTRPSSQNLVRVNLNHKGHKDTILLYHNHSDGSNCNVHISCSGSWHGI